MSRPLTMRDAAEISGIHVRTLPAYVKRGVLTAGPVIICRLPAGRGSTRRAKVRTIAQDAKWHALLARREQDALTEKITLRLSRRQYDRLLAEAGRAGRSCAEHIRMWLDAAEARRAA